VSTLVGVALDRGYISQTDAIVSDIAPSLAGSAYEGVRLTDVLTMSSGARWYENYADPDSDNRRHGRVHATGGSLDAFAASLPRAWAPGTRMRYNSIDTNVLGLVLRQAVGRCLTEILRDWLWDPMGAEHEAFFMIDGEGVEWAGAGLLCTLRDRARLGMLVAKGGQLNGRTLVSQTWMAQRRRPRHRTSSATPARPLPSATGFSGGCMTVLSRRSASTISTSGSIQPPGHHRQDLGQPAVWAELRRSRVPRSGTYATVCGNCAKGYRMTSCLATVGGGLAKRLIAPSTSRPGGTPTPIPEQAAVRVVRGRRAGLIPVRQGKRRRLSSRNVRAPAWLRLCTYGLQAPVVRWPERVNVLRRPTISAIGHMPCRCGLAQMPGTAPPQNTAEGAQLRCGPRARAGRPPPVGGSPLCWHRRCAPMRAYPRTAHHRAVPRSSTPVLLEHRSAAHGRSLHAPFALDRIRVVTSLACDGHVATPLRADRDLWSLQPTSRSHPLMLSRGRAGAARSTGCNRLSVDPCSLRGLSLCNGGSHNNHPLPAGNKGLRAKGGSAGGTTVLKQDRHERPEPKRTARSCKSADRPQP
jgi:hypothetical protein